MMFYNFFMSKTRKCWSVRTLTMLYRKHKKETPRDTITLEGLQVKITKEVNASV